MATTTWTAIRDGYITAIVALSPSGTTKFAERPIKHQTLRAWSAKQGSAAFRKFEITRPNAGNEAPFQDTSEFELTEEFEVTVAYPTQPHNLYGDGALDDLEVVAESDADDIRDCVTSAVNYRSGQNLAAVTQIGLDRSDETMWFLTLRISVRYYKAQVI